MGSPGWRDETRVLLGSNLPNDWPAQEVGSDAPAAALSMTRLWGWPASGKRWFDGPARTERSSLPGGESPIQPPADMENLSHLKGLFRLGMLPEGICQTRTSGICNAGTG
jgi:hypothetical protein